MTKLKQRKIIKVCLIYFTISLIIQLVSSDNNHNNKSFLEKQYKMSETKIVLSIGLKQTRLATITWRWRNGLRFTHQLILSTRISDKHNWFRCFGDWGWRAKMALQRNIRLHKRFYGQHQQQNENPLHMFLHCEATAFTLQS